MMSRFFVRIDNLPPHFFRPAWVTIRLTLCGRGGGACYVRQKSYRNFHLVWRPNAGFFFFFCPLFPWELRPGWGGGGRSEEHTSELQSRSDLVCRLLLEKKKKR